ncbi:MAG: hypothetical protein ACJ8AH_06315 [Stellaceae bacterium]
MVGARWIILAFLAGCAPYDFGNEVRNFSTGVDQLSDAFTTGYNNLSRDLAAQTQLSLDDTRAKVSIAASCGGAIGDLPDNQQPCALYRFQGSKPVLTDVQKTRPRTMVALKVLTDYAHALQAVTNAADRAAFDAASKRLEASVANLAKAANAVAPGASTAAPVIVKMATWIVGAALDKDRFDSLRQGVNNAADPVRTVAKTMGIGLEAVRNDRLTALYETTNALVKPLGPGLAEKAYKERLTDAETTLEMLDEVRRADPAGAADSLATAHDALVAAVNDPERDFANMTTAVGAFADQANALRNALSVPAKH